ncbi:DUF928 domain-containing protein [Nostoc sp. FACHB-973]|nr:DUF928 domain-containing protein [Nostoc sp. FACHB-973]
MKLPLLKIKLALTTSLVSLGFTSAQAQLVNPVITVQTQTLNSSRQSNNPLIFNTPPPPDDIDAPGNRSAGGKRGCEIIGNQSAGVKEKQLTALVPVYEQKDSAFVWGLTTTSHPTLWFYVPYLPKVNAEFALQDETRKIVYQTPISLSGTPGIVSISLPSTTPLLEIGKRYHWYLNIYCQPQQPPIFIHGWIQKKALNSAVQNLVEKATPQKRVTIYANNGYWYDALTTAAELRRQDPKNTEWTNLLQTVGLADIATEPLVECCRSGS